MRIVRWSAAAAAALTTCVPVVAEAATAPTTSTPSAPAPSGQVSGATGTVTNKVSTAPAPAPAPTPSSGTNTTAPRTSTTAQQQTTTTPAPAGSAEAYAAQVGNVLALSHTKASAGGSGTSSTANALELGGNPPASQFGGTQTGEGSKSGALIDTGTTPLGRLAVMPWSVTNTSNSASGLADVVLLNVGDPTTSQSVTLRVLQSQSNANWTPAESTGSSSSDGAILDVGGPSGLVVDVLHADASSSGSGSSYLVSVNGNQIGSSSQANGQCTITIPSLLTLNCLTASGGTGANGVVDSAGGVLSVVLGPGSANFPLGLIQTMSTSGKAAVPASTAPGSSGAGTTPAPAPAPAPAAPAPAAASTPSGNHLAFTGSEIAPLIAASLALGGVGASFVLVVRRRPKLSPR